MIVYLSSDINRLYPIVVYENPKDPIEKIAQFISNLHPIINEEKENFFLFNVGDVIQKYKTWKLCMTNIDAYYAVKCNPHHLLLQLLTSLGLSFDCASKNEIKTMVDMGVQPNRIINAHPYKALSHLKYAKEVGVDLMTFDSHEELFKIKQVHPSAKLIIRIRTDLTKSTYTMGDKFGAPDDQFQELINLCKSLELKLVGVSFHIGSGCNDVNDYENALKKCYKIFEIAKSIGISMNIVDIGGGFPGNLSDSVENQLFMNISFKIKKLITDIFVNNNFNVKVIAEPGRFFATSCMHLFSNVTSIRTNFSNHSNKEQEYHYYLNEGIYGSLNYTIYNNLKQDNFTFLNDKFQDLSPVSVQDKTIFDEKLEVSTFWGPTCDGDDILARQIYAPKLKIGYWVNFKNMGAYTYCCQTNFNGFNKAQCLAYITLENFIEYQFLFSKMI